MVKMYGPAFDAEGNASGELVERDVTPADIAAYERVGYKQGPLPEKVDDEALEVPVEAAVLKGKLPEDFPGHTALEAAGITTYAKVRKNLDSLEELDGIGTVTAEKIREALNTAPEDEGE